MPVSDTLNPRCDHMENRKKHSTWNKNHGLIRNLLLTVFFLAAASLICFILQRIVTTDTHVPLIFVLAVLCVSRFTNGYVYGILASVIAVIGVNYVFTYPYFRLNFTIAGYPLTFLIMLAVSIIVSTLTTQIKQQEQLRLEAEKERMRGNLLRAVSHDIRTPLTSIVGSSSAILENYDRLSEQEKKGLITDINQEGEWLNRIVENLLSVTRINKDSSGIQKSEEMMEEVLESAVLKFKKRAPSTSIKVDIPEEPILVPMDPILIEQVLINLMDNSVIHGNAKLILLTVRKNDSAVCVTVRDNGNGIDPALFPHLFDGSLPLQSGNAEREGMKIGLSVCMSIIQAHDGSLSAENNPEEGASVFFTIPLK